MAEFLPFRGILYNPERIADMSQVVTPPYDVISQQQRDAFYQTHPNNPIRLILGKPEKTDTNAYDWHKRAATFFTRWLSDGILIQDDQPAFYLLATEFILDEKKVTRYGIIGRVRLEPFEKGVVLPHERTFSKVRSERFQLMKQCHANFSPIFGIYSDPENEIGKVVTSVEAKPPDLDFQDSEGHRQQMWRITDPDWHHHMVTAMESQRIYIADGHHRYETALNYRNWIAETHPDFTPEHPANYVMMYLASMADPGLVILPAHRILKGIGKARMANFEQLVEPWFFVLKMAFTPSNQKRVLAEFLATLSARGKMNGNANCFGVLKKDENVFYLLTLKPGAIEKLSGDTIAPCLRQMDVTVLTHVMLMNILGFDNARLDNETLISYASKAEQAVDKINSGQWDITFLMNPTRIDQMRTVAEEGLIMPRKSTYFYPKVGSGIVMNKLY